MTAREWIDAARAAGLTVYLGQIRRNGVVEPEQRWWLGRPVKVGGLELPGIPEFWPDLDAAIADVTPAAIFDELKREAGR